jgi:hypothetical protein
MPITKMAQRKIENHLNCIIYYGTKLILSVGAFAQVTNIDKHLIQY